MPVSQKKIETGDRLKRSLKFTAIRSEEDEDSRTVEIAFSSEEPYERYFGTEVLSHEADNIRLDRLNNGGAVLLDHDTRKQIGVVVSARIDADKKGRAVIRFSKSALGDEIFQDVIDGIRSLVSVGYRIHTYEVTERKGQSDLVRVTDWEPFEVSIVAVPADASVGVGRSLDETEQKENTTIQKSDEGNTMPDPVKEEIEAPDIGAIQAKTRKEELNRISKIRAVADQFEIDPLNDLADEAIREGTDYNTFNTRALQVVGKQNNAARAESEHDGEVDLSRKEKKEYSFLRLMNALQNPNDRSAQKRAAFELEVSSEAVKGFGDDFKVRGAFIPNSVLGRDLSAGVPAAGGNLIADNLLPSSFIDLMRNSMKLAAAGMQTMGGLVGNVSIPRQTSGAAMSWIDGEDGDAGESEPTFDQVKLTPKDAACYTEVTRRLLQQSTPSVDRFIVNDLASAIGIGMDLAGLYGTGANGQPLGITLQAGINVLDLAGVNPTYAELVNMVRKVMDDNALLGSPSWMISPAGWEAFRTTSKQAGGAEGNFIMDDSNTALGYPTHSTNQMTTEEYLFGDFSQIILGEWGGIELNVDPFTHSLKGKVRYVIFKTADIAVRNPQAFCHAHDGII